MALKLLGTLESSGGNVGIGTATPSSKLEVVGSGGTVLDIQGSAGQLFSVTDSLTGDLFAVSDISGIPILNVNSSGAVDIDGTLSLGDSNKIQLGASQDLQIYHDGSNSYISEVGTGDLIISADNDLTFKDGSGNIMANMNASNSVELMYGNSKKFETTNTGVTITGDLTVSNITKGSAGFITIGDDSKIVSIGQTNEINFITDVNSDETIYFNHRGYNDASTRFRSLEIRNGKGAAIANFNGVNKATTLSGTLAATNFSGSSSGTNTGDQDLSGYLTSETFSSSDVVMSLSGTDVTAGESITLAGGLSYSGTTLTSANDNTTYTAGTGLTLTGTSFSVTANTYATAAQGTTADAALPKAGGALTGALSISAAANAAWLASITNTSVSGHGLLIQAGGTTGTRYITQWKDAAGTERFHMDDTGEAYFQNTLTASGGINGLTLANGGISGTNYNITGVNQLEISDPGEGIVFKSGSSGDMTLAIVDDTSDNILRFSGTGATFDVAGSLTSTNITIADGMYHEGDTNTSITFSTDAINLNTGGGGRINITDSTTKVNNDLIIAGGKTFSLGEAGEEDDNGRSVLIEGAANAGNGEGAGRIFFSENNNTATNKYGLSLYYEGDPNIALPSGFQPNTGNGTWSLRRHNNSVNGAAIMSGSKTSSNVTFAGTIGATNFSGSSSGTNTGDQTLPTLSSLGALSTSAAASTYLPLAGGTMTGILSHNNRAATNVAHWSASGSSTGAIKITIPGSHSSNYSMLVLRITAYEYNSSNHTVYYVSGHDWTSGWYNNGVTKLGDSSKDISLAHDGSKDYVILGLTSASWSYGHVTVDVVSHPSFYSGVMNISSGWAISQVTSLEGITVQSVTNRKVLTNADEGSGNGIDADTVDGLQAASFLRSDANDTASGTLTLSGTDWYLLGLGARGASAGAYGIGNRNDNNYRQLTFHVPNQAAYNSTGTIPSFGWYSNGAIQLMKLESDSGDLTVTGTVSASNLSGTNTGDQDLSSYLTAETFSATDTVMSIDGNDLTAGVSVSLAGGLSYNASTNTLTQTDNNTVYTHPTSAGNKHIPTGGSAGEFLKYSSSGTAVWATPSYTTNTDTQLSDSYVIGLFSGGTNVSITAAGVISSTNTTYSTADFDAAGSADAVQSNLDTIAGNVAGISNQSNTDVDTGTETIAQVSTGTYTAAFFDFVIKNGTNVRAGTVYSCHDGTNVEFTETSTVDLGDTSDVSLAVDISGTNMRLRATTTSNNWSVKSLVRAI